MHAASASPTFCRSRCCWSAITVLAWAVTASTSNALAAEIQWNGSSNNIWQNVNNWDPFGAPFSVHRVPGDTDTANLLTPVGDEVVLGADTAPINGLRIGNQIELFTNGYRLHVSDAGNAQTLIGAGGTIHVEPRAGGGFALDTDRLLIDDGTVLSLEGGDVSVDGQTTLVDGSRIVSPGPASSVHFGGDVSLDDQSFIEIDAAQFTPGAVVFLEGSSVMQVAEELNIPSGTTFDLRHLSILATSSTGSTITVHANGSILLDQSSQLHPVAGILVDGGTITVTGSNPNAISMFGATFRAVNSASVATDGDLVISRNNTFEFNSGADLSLTSTFSDLLVGDPQLGKGTLVVDGNGSTLEVPDRLSVGSSSQGDSVTLTNGSMGSVFNLHVGATSTGNLTVETGADLSGTFVEIGSGSGSHGEAVIINPGSTWMNLYLNVGVSGVGELTIANGGTATSFEGQLGIFSNSDGFVEVTGVGSTWNINGPVSVGFEGSGELRILDGGRVVNDAGFIGRAAGSTGTVFIQGLFGLGADTTWEIQEDLSIGGDAPTNQNGGTGTLNIRRYSSVTVAHDTVLFPNGRVELDGAHSRRQPFVLRAAASSTGLRERSTSTSSMATS